MRAVILLRCSPGKYRKVAREIKNLSEDILVFPILGRWDVFVKTKIDNLNELREILGKIMKIGSIEESETLIEMEV